MSDNLVKTLFEQGLGELFILHSHNERVYFGKLLYEKGHMVIKDNNLLSDIKPAQLKPCWESGYIGLVCSEEGHTWESLTFYGIEQCNLPVDFGKTRHGVLLAAENQYGDNLVDFVGSVYRAYQLMLDNHILPVVLLDRAKTNDGSYGLIISDLLTAPLDISLIYKINSEIRKSVDQQLIISIDDIQMEPAEFDKMFNTFLPHEE